MGLYIILEDRQKPYIRAGLFRQYIRTVPSPFMDERRTNAEFAEKPAILLMRNCSIHTRPADPMTLREQNVKAITFPPHPSPILQALDLGLFGV
jgi:hypothetical protein